MDEALTEVIYARPLLCKLQTEAQQRPVKRTRDARSRIGETLPPRPNSRPGFFFEDGVHFLQVILDKRVLRVVLFASQSSHGQADTVPVVLGSEPSRRFGQKEDTNAEQEGKGDAEADDDAPRCVLPFDGADAVVDQVGHSR